MVKSVPQRSLERGMRRYRVLRFGDVFFLKKKQNKKGMGGD